MMEKIDIIKLPFYKWKLDEKLIEDAITIVKDLSFSKNNFNYISYDTSKLELISTIINQNLAELTSNLFPLESSFCIQATEFWVNKNYFTNYQHRHNHPNSMFSGVIYLSESDNIGATRFYFENIYNVYKFILGGTSKPDDLTFDFVPEKGSMIMFPSNIQHSVLPNKSQNTRYTISFNSFFKGKIGNNSFSLII